MLLLISNIKGKMSVSCDNDAFTYESYDDEVIGEVKDPLEDLDIYTHQPKYYRLNETVFAEPIAIVNVNATNDAEVDNELCVSNNIISKKRNGKKNKNFIDTGGTSSSYKCSQANCTKIFSTTTLLYAHIRRVHRAERNKYICEHCGVGFSARYLLQRHMAVHSEQRAECPLCGKMLSRRTNMSVHLSRHANSRPHSCHLCQRGFVRRATLDTHLRFVHRTGELSCRKCGQVFPSRKLLINHKSCRSKYDE